MSDTHQSDDAKLTYEERVQKLKIEMYGRCSLHKNHFSAPDFLFGVLCGSIGLFFITMVIAILKATK